MDSTENALISQELRQELSQSVWIKALSIPIIPWVQPFIPFLEIPNNIKNNALWRTIYIENLAALRSRLDCPEPLTRQEVETIYPVGIIRAMNQLAQQGGVAVALELERWVRRYLRPHESHFPLRRWSLILKLTFLIERPDRIPPPPALQQLTPTLEKLDRSFTDARYKIHDVAPSDPRYSKLSKCIEATLLSEVMYRTFAVQGLRKIARELNSEECQKVVEWAEHQAEVMIPHTDPSQLCGDRYLRAEPPGFDMPSIFGFSVVSAQ